MNVNGLFNKCRRYEASLSLLAADALDASERAAVETHLAGCPACRAKLAQLQHLTRGLTEAGRRFAEIEAPVSLRRRWMTKCAGRRVRAIQFQCRSSQPGFPVGGWRGEVSRRCGSLVLLFRVSAPDSTQAGRARVCPPTSWREVYAALQVDKPVPLHRADAGSPAPSRQIPPNALPPRSQRPGAQSTTNSPIA